MNNPFSMEATTVGLMLWNPTNEDLDMQYAGISISLKAGQQQTFAVKCATHLLNGFGPRGLTSLTYGSDEEKVGREAIQRNLDFKKKQVVEYNQRNENRKHRGLGYLPPTEHVKKYSMELGLGLLEPYTIKDEEKGELSRLASENRELKEQMTKLMEAMNGLIKQTGKKDSEEIKESENAPGHEEEKKPRGNPNWRK